MMLILQVIILLSLLDPLVKMNMYLSRLRDHTPLTVSLTHWAWKLSARCEWHKDTSNRPSVVKTKWQIWDADKSLHITSLSLRAKSKSTTHKRSPSSATMGGQMLLWKGLQVHLLARLSVLDLTLEQKTSIRLTDWVAGQCCLNSWPSKWLK